jgi:hypothetical protein
MLTVTNLVKDGNKVEFSHYRANHMYYNIIFEGDTYQFHIPLEEVGNGTLNRSDRALSGYMRWIRKGIEDNTLIKL